MRRIASSRGRKATTSSARMRVNATPFWARFAEKVARRRNLLEPSRARAGVAAPNHELAIHRAMKAAGKGLLAAVMAVSLTFAPDVVDAQNVPAPAPAVATAPGVPGAALPAAIPGATTPLGTTAASPGVHLSINPGDDMSGSLKIFMLMTLLTLLPSLMMTMTCFTRIIIVFGFLRQAMGTQQTPPNQVIVGLSLFLTLFIMTPTITQIDEQAYTPYVNGEIGTVEAMEKGLEPLRDFMLRQTYEKDLALFFQLSKRPKPQTAAEVPTLVLIPAYITSELKTAFQIGFLIYVPFLVIDMLIASVLMSMGMMMLPPVIISLPFKLLLFVMIDGWYLIIGTLIESFH